MSPGNAQRSFETALLDAVSLLRRLPRQRAQLSQARVQVNGFRAAHRSIQLDLLVDQPRGSKEVDYDLFLTHPDGGTVAVCFRADEGRPWVVEYADHWAVNLVMSVNGEDVGLPAAFLFLRRAAHQFPNLMEELVNQVLMAQAVREDPPPVRDSEVQKMADSFRRDNGLLTAEATERWWRELGISEERFFEMMKWEVQVEKLRKRVAADMLRRGADAHSHEEVRFFRVEVPARAMAKKAVSLAKRVGLLAAMQQLSGEMDGIQAQLFTKSASELPSLLAGAPRGAVVGPVEDRGVFWIAQVLRRGRSRRTASVRRAVEQALLAQWLRERRERAEVRWHWMEEASSPPPL